MQSVTYVCRKRERHGKYNSYVSKHNSIVETGVNIAYSGNTQLYTHIHVVIGNYVILTAQHINYSYCTLYNQLSLLLLIHNISSHFTILPATHFPDFHPTIFSPPSSIKPTTTIYLEAVCLAKLVQVGSYHYTDIIVSYSIM